jgi:anti-anti-sigma factor
MTSGRTPTFAAITNFEDGDTVLALQGSVDDGAAFKLGAVLEAAIAKRPESIVLDISGLTFMGPTGLVAISNAEQRLAELGIKLTVRSPSTLVERLLSIMASAEVSRLESASFGHGHLGAEQIDGISFGNALGLGGFSDDLRNVVAMPTHYDVVDGALRLLVDLTLARVDGADGVSVSLMRHGQLSTVAASDQTILDMDANQYSTGEGPCIDASVKGRWFYAESLATEGRWPAFTPQAIGLGIKSILSSPLHSLAAPIGALNIYSRTDSAFDVDAEATATVFANRASVILSDAGTGVSDGRLAAQFQEALRSRQVIALAQGVIMEQEGVDQTSAFEALLRLSLHSGMPLRSQAETVVLAARHPTLGLERGLDG